MSLNDGGLDTLEHRRPRVGLLTHKRTPLRVQVGIEDVLTQANGAEAYQRYAPELIRGITPT
jgi:hypothetical protein